MTNDLPHGEKTEDDGIDIQMQNKRLKVDRQTAKTLIQHIGPELRWIVWAIGWSVAVIGTAYALSFFVGQ